MKKYILTLLSLLFLCSPCFAVIELDADDNGAIDINKGGSNSTSIANIPGQYKVVFWGDSLVDITAPWLAYTLTDKSVYDGGVTGESSTAIKNRMVSETSTHDYITVIWAGRNNWSSPTTVKADIATMVAALGSGSRYVVLSIPNSSAEPAGNADYISIMALNAELAAAYPNNYLDVRAVWVAAYDSGISQDVTDHTNDIPPTSLRSDTLHPNAAGARIIAAAIKTFIDEMAVLPDGMMLSSSAANLAAMPPPADVLSIKDGGVLRYGGQIVLSGDVILKNYALFSEWNQAATGEYNFSVGSSAMSGVTSGSYNIGIGSLALYSVSEGENNLAMGYRGLYNTSTGGFNIAIGRDSLFSNTTGIKNIGIGDSAGYAISSGGGNVAIGTNTLKYAATANGTVAIGDGALDQATDVYNITAIGNGAFGSAYSGSGGLAVGSEAGNKCTSAHGITAIGESALSNNTTGDYSTAVGQNAGKSIVTGSGSVFLGFEAGYYETGSNKLFIDNAKRTDEADARVKSLIYGIFDSSTSNQSLTVNGAFAASVGGSAGKATCWKADGKTIGYCSSVVASDGSCTCN
jgi:hypothetical protein